MDKAGESETLLIPKIGIKVPLATYIDLIEDDAR